MTRFLLICLLAIVPFISHARIIYSRMTPAEWGTTGTWSTVSGTGGTCGCTPTNGDTIYITSGHTISVDGSYDYDPGTAMFLHIYGELKFTVGKIDLPTGSKILLYDGALLNTSGGGGSSDRIRINGTTIWTSTAGDYTGPMNADEGGFATGLPVEMVYFTSKVHEHSVALLWGTAQEINNNYFEVQRSFDGINFSVIEVVNGKGTTKDKSEYIVEVDLHSGKTVYYRLKQVDYDSQFSISNVISVYSSGAFSGMKVFPNPIIVGSFVNVEIQDENLEEETLVVLTDAMGNELFSNLVVKTENGVNTVLNASQNITPGIYYIKATSNNKIFNQKLIVK